MRQPKPFFRKQTQSWYVQIKGKQINLGKDEPEAFHRYHEIMANPEEAVAKPARTTDIAVGLIDAFLEYASEHNAERTYIWYARHLQPFFDHIGDTITVAQLKPHHLTSYLATLSTSSASTKNGAASAVKRAFNWAVQEGHIQSSPFAGYRAPAAKPRDIYITPQQWATFIAALKADDSPALPIVVFMKETGCRPIEAREASPEHLDGKSIVFDREDSKGKRERRVVLLNDAALRLAQDLPFVNSRGKRWTQTALNQSFRKHDLDFKIFPYAIRHTVITDWLTAGLTPIEVANLAGHTDLAMIQRVYSHLDRKSEHLRERLNAASSVVASLSDPAVLPPPGQPT